MMARNKLPKPTEAELAILQVLWERGPSPVHGADLPRITRQGGCTSQCGLHIG